MVSETLADVLLRKIHRLPHHLQEALKVASFIGFCFRKATLHDVIKDLHDEEKSISYFTPTGDSSTANSTTFSISMGLQGGFIERTKSGFKFTHDKVLSSFRALADAEEARIIQTVIGSVFLSRGDSESLYHAAYHLNYAPELFSETTCEGTTLPRVNLEAARYCKDRSAFRDASMFLQFGLELLDPNEQWNSDNFDETFEIMEMLAKMALIIGNLDECRKLTDHILSHATSVEMKIPSLLVNVDAHFVGNDIDASISSSNEALRELGIRMPRRAVLRNVLFKLFKVKRMMKGRSDSDILNLPVIQDKRVTTALRLLCNTFTYCVMKEEEHTATYAALLAFELTLKKGLSPYSASALSIFGIAELTLGNIDAAYRFGRLSLELMRVVSSKEADCVTVVNCLSMISHWRDPLKDLVEPLDKAMQSGFETGDILWGILVALNCVTVRINLGHNLRSIEDLMSPYDDRICDFNQDAVKAWVQPAFQYVLNLQMKDAYWRDVTMLTGQIMDEDTYMRHAAEGNHGVMILNVLMLKVQLAYHFGFYFEAEAMLKKLPQVGQANRYHFSFHSWQLIGALTYFQLYRDSGSRKYLRNARAFANSLMRLEKLGWPNASSLVSLVLAEELSVKRKAASWIVAEAYTKAIGAMKKAGWIHLEGLANERAGFFLASVDKADEARHHLENAERLYRDDWGALAKCEWLQVQSTRLLGANAMSQESLPEIVRIQGE